MPKSKGSKKKGGSPSKKMRTDSRSRVYVAFITTDNDDALTEIIGDSGTPLAIKWLYERNGKFRNCGFVDFASQQEANSFVKKNGSSHNGRNIVVRHCDSSGLQRKGITGKTEMYVGNIPDDDKSAMSEFIGTGTYKIRFLKDSDGDFRNAAFVDFPSPGPADSFKVEKNGEMMGSNKIRVAYAPNNRPTAFVMGFENSMSDEDFNKFVGSFSDEIGNINWKNDNTYCFVTFNTIGAMNKFIAEKGDTDYEGRNIKVSVAKRAQRKQ